MLKKYFLKISLALPQNLETKISRMLGVKKIKHGNLKFYGEKKIKMKLDSSLYKRLKNLKFGVLEVLMRKKNNRIKFT